MSLNDSDYRASIQELSYFLTVKGKISEWKEVSTFTNSHRCWNFDFKTLNQETNITWTVQAQLRERWDTLGSYALSLLHYLYAYFATLSEVLACSSLNKGGKDMVYEKYESII